MPVVAAIADFFEYTARVFAVAPALGAGAHFGEQIFPREEAAAVDFIGDVGGGEPGVDGRRGIGREGIEGGQFLLLEGLDVLAGEIGEELAIGGHIRPPQSSGASIL